MCCGENLSHNTKFFLLTVVEPSAATVEHSLRARLTLTALRAEDGVGAGLLSSANSICPLAKAVPLSIELCHLMCGSRAPAADGAAADCRSRIKQA